MVAMRLPGRARHVFQEGPTMTMSRFAVALSAAVAVGSLAFIANPAAAATAMADCNKQWNLSLIHI